MCRDYIIILAILNAKSEIWLAYTDANLMRWFRGARSHQACKHILMLQNTLIWAHCDLECDNLPDNRDTSQQKDELNVPVNMMTQWKWKHFPCYWPFVRGIHRSLVDYFHNGQWRETLMFSLMYAWKNTLNKQWSSQLFETPERSLWRQCKDHVCIIPLDKHDNIISESLAIYNQ